VSAIASLFVRLDRASPALLQEQIRDGLRQAIAAGVLGPGIRLPSSRSLAADLSVSRVTIVGSLLQLVEEGYLVTRQRSGTFVADELPEEAVLPPPQASLGRPLRPSRRTEELAREAVALQSLRPRPKAFRLSRPALDSFPIREWSRIVSRRSARASVAQLDYGPESPELRSVIAELVSSSRGMRVLPGQVLLFGGGQRALEFAVSAVLNPGERVWMEEPGYPGARNVLLSAGASIANVPVDEEGMVVAKGRALAPDARLAYTTASCQFPLGVPLSAARRQQLLQWAREANACVVEDDDSCEFRYAGGPLPAMQAMAPERVLYVNSFSRTMFPAIRLGYLIAPEALVDRLRAARATMEEQLPSLVQLALADFIAEGHFVRHLRRMKLLYRRRADALSAAAPPGLRLRPVQCGLQAVAELAPGLDPFAVAAAAAARGVEVAPLARPRALILGFGAVDPESSRAAMEKLAAAIAEVRRRS
jgi:GntR family transcriptional regulator/MocR family aminotransferase